MRKAMLLASILAIFCGESLGYSTRVPMYQLYSSTYGDWFYTIDPTQRSLAIQYGYADYGIAFYVEDNRDRGGVPLLRFYNEALTDHFYTSDLSESSYVQANGWVYERTEGYVRSSPEAADPVTGMFNEVPMYRASYVDPNTGAQHYMTTDQGYYNQLITYYGYGGDGIKEYVYPHAGVLDAAKVAVFAYHTGEVDGDCTGYNTTTIALRQDLDALHLAGFQVAPIRMILDWASGVTDGSALPPNPIGITFDDGNNEDWNDISHPSCPGILHSAKYQIGDYLSHHSDAAALQVQYASQGYPFATSFVIASQTAHQFINPDYWQIGLTSDWWWSAATDSLRYMDIQNHSTDHDHQQITNGPVYDTATQGSPGLGSIPLPVGGSIDGYWNGAGTFCRIGKDTTTNATAINEVPKAAESILGTMQFYAQNSSPLSMPSILATPNAHMDPGLKSYLETHTSTSHTQYAFNGTGGWVRRNPSQSRFDFRRFLHGRAVANETADTNSTADAVKAAQGDPSMDHPSVADCSNISR